MQVDSTELLPLIRLIDNRCCADCSCPLGDFSSIFASVRYGVWLCADCAAIHEVLHSGIEDDSVIKKVQTASWAASDVACMKQYSSNVAFNGYYERYIPEGWAKIKAETGAMDKTLFIKAKYIGKLFFLPPLRQPRSAHLAKVKASSNLPSTLLDVFVVMTPTALGVSLSDGVDFKTVEFADTMFRAEVTSSLACGDPMLSKIPDNLEAFVYPDDCAVSTLYKSPFFFSIALTDENGRRQFGGVLQVRELMSAAEMSKLLRIAPGSDRWPFHWPVFYAVKSLVILSHYPYYNLFREVLEVLYRISLSAAPVPMERYIQHVVTELPLPPQGRIEVAFTIGDRTLTLWRPPKNQLPMIDFSLRPLFSILSVDSILQVFGALCTETRTCFCASNTSLLGPVSEAFLSFLFPFVWQGAYIPVLPYKLTDILDAPVPFIVGIDSKYLREMSAQYRPDKVLYVDLDHDLIYYGNQSEALSKNQSLVAIPDKMREKLKIKLDEFGACVYRVDQSIFRTSGDIFLRNEHLVPIRKFASDSGVMYVHHSETPMSSIDPNASISESHKCYVACSRSSLPVIDVLDSNNNTRSDFATAGDTPSWADNKFDGIEIRGAFLRFFVSAFLDYQDFVKDTDILFTTSNPSKNSSKRKTFSSFRSKVEKMSGVAGSPGSRPNSLPLEGKDDESVRRSIAMNEDGTPRDKTFFDKTQFLKEHPGEFYETLCSTQMFSVFMREQLTCPDQNEIKFFTEAIVDKRNRSKKTILKISTPFLSDRNDAVKKTFVPPYPLRSGLVLGATFSYSVFPDILQKNLAPKRDIPKLVAGPELARLHGSVSSTFKSSILGSNAHAKLLFEKDQRDKMEASVADAASRYSVFIRGVVRFQSYFRMRRPRLSYLRILEAALKIETAFRAMMSYRIARMSGAKKFTCSIKIQSRVRSFLARRYYIRILLAVKTISKFKSMFMAVTMRKVKLRKLIKLQMFCRRRFLRRKWQLMRCMAVVRKAVRNFLRLLRYRRYNNAAIRLQAFLRGRVRYVVLKKQRTSYLSVMRNMLVTLWRLDNTKLLYRSNFWILLGGDSENCSNFNVKLHELELSRLIVDLGLFGSVLNQKESFSAHIDTLQSLIDRPADLANRIQRSNPNLLKRAAALKEERLLIYRAMKGETDDHARIIFFEKFGISHAKKRKQTLSDRVWSEGSNADDSAAAVRGILSNVYEDMQWLQAVRAERLQADVLSVASALLYRVQHNKKKRSRRTSLLAPLPSSPPTTKNGLIMSPKIKSFS